MGSEIGRQSVFSGQLFRRVTLCGNLNVKGDEIVSISQSGSGVARVSRRVGAALAALGLALPLVVVPAAADQGASGKVNATGGQHKDGFNELTTRVPIPEDQIDLRTNQPHACAGREAVYQGHFDALYSTVYNNELSVMIVDGQVVTPADKLCMRLAPDAATRPDRFAGIKEGEEVSRLVVPDNEDYRFLGEPGTILWNAPRAVSFMDKWRPLWAGLGAFDPNHELDGNVPRCLKLDYSDPEKPKSYVTFTLVGYTGPGEMTVFDNVRGKPKPYIVTSQGKYSFEYGVGGHGHFDWTFTKPGVYRQTWVASVERDGEVIKSAPTDVIWLVGPDEEIGLPAGTTVELNEIKFSAEQRAEENGLTPRYDDSAPETFTADFGPDAAPTPLPSDGLCGNGPRPNEATEAGDTAAEGDSGDAKMETEETTTTAEESKKPSAIETGADALAGIIKNGIGGLGAAAAAGAAAVAAAQNAGTTAKKPSTEGAKKPPMKELKNEKEPPANTAGKRPVSTLKNIQDMNRAVTDSYRGLNTILPVVQKFGPNQSTKEEQRRTQNPSTRSSNGTSQRSSGNRNASNAANSGNSGNVGNSGNSTASDNNRSTVGQFAAGAIGSLAAQGRGVSAMSDSGTASSGSSGSSNSGSSGSSSRSGSSSSKPTVVKSNSTRSPSSSAAKPTGAAAISAKSAKPSSSNKAGASQSNAKGSQKSNGSNDASDNSESKSVDSLSSQLTSGGWASGVMFGVGGTALLAGLLFFLAALRNTRDVRKALAAREHEYVEYEE